MSSGKRISGHEPRSITLESCFCQNKSKCIQLRAQAITKNTRFICPEATSQKHKGGN